MILDSSAIVAIFFQEAGYDALLAKLMAAQEVGIGAPTLVECGIVLSARLNQDARGLLARFMEEAAVTLIPFTETHYSTALGSWLNYGKGRHPAGLNFGDCMAYAMAKVSDLPLLCIGEDFPQTDLLLG